MTPTRILFWQFLLSVGLIVLFTWASTQWTAAAFGYQPRLGRPWFYAGDWPIYKPWRFFQWWYAYDSYAPGVFHKGALLVVAGGIAAFLSAVAGSVLRARQKKFVTTYGSSRWADERDITKGAVFARHGVMLGRAFGRYLRHDGPEHVIAFAPTRSGKGVGLVVPTLLSWGGSALIHDIKGENWALTAGWRSSFSRCLRFDPTDLLSARYNPLMEIRKGPNEVRDAQNIADILIDPDGTKPRDHWDDTAQDLFVGAILHVLYAEENKTLAGLSDLLADPSRTIDETFEAMRQTNHLGTDDAPRVHPAVAKAARIMENRSGNEASSVLSSAVKTLSLYNDPIIQRATGVSDWTIDDLVKGDAPVSLYLCVPPSDLSRTRPLMRLILNQIARRLTEAMPDPAVPQHQLLLMLDEFPALGRLDFFETSIAFMAGYGVRCFLVAQSLNQVEKAYGVNNAILDSCHVRVTFATNDERTAKRISDMLGSKTEQRHQRNYAGHRLAPWLSHVMVSQQETSRQLLTPGEVMQLPKDDALVLVSTVPPIRAQKLKYYEDGNFSDRAGLAPPVPEVGEPLGSVGAWIDCIRSPHPGLGSVAEGERQDDGREVEIRIDGVDGSGGRSALAGKPSGLAEDTDADRKATRKLMEQARLLALKGRERSE